ncbi:fibrobacter succinogenes major paralogous domain-containing protein [Flavobacterium aciduliphilum]|uniref:Uncharacterized protein (TIGR02145 family) n=1 Tax=Flavobacterium aciduliphilum TaxID=1101402 RepID=A0A328YEW7_9FLAO|nr:fibrobacter succinogenes major paralogous domain-containing protein [Flavobacterium aciduliphilum]RAR72459.1 uncharacterized protein (TIGR02145 family) [Flavobacterium aciduliphilum]
MEQVKIGNQIWSNRNLDVDTFRNGEKIIEAKSTEEWENANKNCIPSWCYYDFNSENGKIYGKLYNWYAINDLRGLAPDGWRIPTSDDWKELNVFLTPPMPDGMGPADYSNFLGKNKKVGAKLKSVDGWAKSDYKGNGNGTDEFGFCVLPGGFHDGRNMNNSKDITIGAKFWCASNDKTENTSYIDFALNLQTDFYTRNYKFIDYPMSMSVRCVKE